MTIISPKDLTTLFKNPSSNAVSTANPSLTKNALVVTYQYESNLLVTYNRLSKILTMYKYKDKELIDKHLASDALFCMIVNALEHTKVKPEPIKLIKPSDLRKA